MNLPNSLLPWLVATSVLLIIAVALKAVLFREPPMPYVRAGFLLTPAERKFFDALMQAVGGRYHVFVKIRLADLIDVPAGTANYMSWAGKIRQKHIDFILADRSTVQPVLAVELDDASHQRKDRQARDIFVDAALQRAGLPILRVKTAKAYVIKELAALVVSQVAGSGRSAV